MISLLLLTVIKNTRHLPCIMRVHDTARSEFRSYIYYIYKYDKILYIDKKNTLYTVLGFNVVLLVLINNNNTGEG